MKNKKRIIFVLISIVIAIFISYIIFRGSYLEILEIGEDYIGVFWQNLRYTLITLIVNFIIIYLLFYIANKLIKSGLKDFFDKENKKMPKLINKSISFGVAIILSAFTSNIILEKALLFIHSSQFGKVDPIFNLDIGYFIFQKPFMELVLWYILIAIGIITAYAVTYYIICFNKFFDGIDIKSLKTSKPVKQLTKIIMLFAIILSCLIFLKTQNIETEKFMVLEDGSSYSINGAGLADITIKLWGYRILSLVIIVSVYMAIRAFKTRKYKKSNIIYISCANVYNCFNSYIIVL